MFLFVFIQLQCCLTYFTRRGAKMSFCRFFYIKSLRKSIFSSNLLDFESNFKYPLKIEVAKVRQSFPSLRFAEATLRNMSVFGP